MVCTCDAQNYSQSGPYGPESVCTLLALVGHVLWTYGSQTLWLNVCNMERECSPSITSAK